LNGIGATTVKLDDIDDTIVNADDEHEAGVLEGGKTGASSFVMLDVIFPSQVSVFESFNTSTSPRRPNVILVPSTMLLGDKLTYEVGSNVAARGIMVVVVPPYFSFLSAGLLVLFRRINGCISCGIFRS
jgi:hypothetical protein